MKQTTDRLHIVEGVDWKAAVISLLDSRYPCHPWRYGFGEAHAGDPVAIVLNTDPASVLTSVGRIGIDGRPDLAVIEWPFHGVGLVDLTTLTLTLGLDEDPRDCWQLRGYAAQQLETMLLECEYHHDHTTRFGHSSVVQARILLHSKGLCTGCDDSIELVGHDAGENLYIHTVDVPPREAPQVVVKTERVPSYYYGPIPDSCWRPDLPVDWPGVLCSRCRQRMNVDGHTRLLDFRFSQHPKCPRCGAQRTQRAVFGEPSPRGLDDLPPWRESRGCIVTNDIWTCTMCLYRW
ncbi:hypothetical protein [Mycolicibacterium thermoresistibile]